MNAWSDENDHEFKKVMFSYMKDHKYTINMLSKEIGLGNSHTLRRFLINNKSVHSPTRLKFIAWYEALMK